MTTYRYLCLAVLIVAVCVHQIKAGAAKKKKTQIMKHNAKEIERKVSSYLAKRLVRDRVDFLRYSLYILRDVVYFLRGRVELLLHSVHFIQDLVDFLLFFVDCFRRSRTFSTRSGKHLQRTGYRKESTSSRGHSTRSHRKSTVDLLNEIDGISR